MNGWAKPLQWFIVCAFHELYSPCSSHELINFIYLLLFFKEKLEKVIRGIPHWIRSDFYLFLNGICPYALLLLSCEGLASHADVLRLVTRSSPRTSAQKTGHLAFVLGYSKPSRVSSSKKIEKSSFACCFYWNPYKLYISRKVIKIMFCFDFCFPKEAEAVRRRQLRNDRLTFQWINRVCRFDGFPWNLLRTFTERYKTKLCQRFLYFKCFPGGGLQRNRLRDFSIVELDRSIQR